MNLWAIKETFENSVRDSVTWTYVLAGAVAVVVAALFCTADAVWSSLSSTRLAVLGEEVRGWGRRAVLRYMQDAERVLARWLVGRLVATVLASVLLLFAFYPSWGLWSVLWATLATVLGIGLLTELGKAIARHWMPSSAWALAQGLYSLELLVLPLSFPLWIAAKVFGKLLPPLPTDSKLREHEVGLILQEGQRDGTLELERAQMLKNILEFEDLMVSEVMVPRTKVTAIDAMMPLAQVLAVVSEKGHSRYPVFRDSVDNVVGLLYAKDLFRIFDEPGFDDKTAGAVMRRAVNFVPETKPVSVLLREMRARRWHMAVVADDYGGVSGIVTLEDIIEEIVGDIQDEHDKEQDRIELLDDGSALVDASIPIADLAEYLGVEFPDEGDFVSLGGWMIHRAGRVPEPGATIQACGLTFVVRQADERRVIKVEICSAGHEDAEAGETSKLGQRITDE